MQHRIAPDPAIIAEYAALMTDGVELPPVTVWWDGERYWLSDGFRRVSAAEMAGISAIRAEVRRGAREDALWDSYAANSTHGDRRKPAETERVIGLALRHPNSANLSNVEIARHLHVAEVTVRRWRSKLSSSGDEDSARLVTRSGATFPMSTANIGKNHGAHRESVRRDLRAEIATMRAHTDEGMCSVLNVIEHWARGQLTPLECVQKLERAVRSRKWDGEPAITRTEP